jgi:hypothetical protein
VDVQSTANVVVALASVGSLIAVAVQLRSLAKQTKEAARQTELATRQTEEVARQTEEVAKQSKATSEATTASFSFAATAALLTVDQFMADRPAIRRALYGRITAGPGDDDDAQRVDAAVEMLVDMYEGVMVNRKLLTKDLLDGWLAYIQAVMKTPGARRFWLANRDWYGIDVQEAIDPVVPLVEAPTREAGDHPLPAQPPESPLDGHVHIRTAG